MANDLAQAQSLIAECLEAQNPYLDLGNCGITDLNDLPELFACVHLETLILSNKWWDDEKRNWINSNNCGFKNEIKFIPTSFGKLQNLLCLKIGGDIDERWQVENVDVLSSLKSLKSLSLRSTRISGTVFLYTLTSLETLDLHSAGITDIHFLSELGLIHSLDLSDNHIFDPKPLSNLILLRNLNIRDNLVTDIGFLTNLLELRHLNIGSNIILDISKLQSLTKLRSLHLDNCQVFDISSLSFLTQLKTVDLNSNEISDISSLKGLIHLHSLDLHSNEVSDFSSLKSLIHLRSLDLHSNEISDISSLKSLIHLRSLDLHSNEIVDISSLADLNHLEVLDLGMNKIRDISSTCNLNFLRTLVLGLNEISDISPLKNLNRLRKLDLGENPILDFSYLSNLTQLEKLFLVQNEISNLNFISNLIQLQCLNLNLNQISDISYLSELISLQSLSLAANEISDISFLSKLRQLQKLDIRDNLIHDLPEFLFLLNLTVSNREHLIAKVEVYNNPITSPPLEVLRQGRQSILDWFEANKEKLNEVKLILIGDPKAGKTSILRRFTTDKFIEGEKQTDGINIESIVFGENDQFFDQTALADITGHFWDFGGQEIMNATHQFFLTNRCVYILVLDARKDTNVSGQIKQWIKRIQVKGGKSPIIVVANQIDVNQGFGFDNQSDLIKDFPQIKAFIKTSCKIDGDDGLAELKTKLAELIPQAPLFNTEIDERWIKIKDNLQEEVEAKHYLNEARFVEICKAADLNEKEGQLNVIRFLHDLGLVLHFENIDLADYFVLDPYWITNGVYKVLTSMQAAKNKGKVCIEELEFIINEEEEKKEKYHSADIEEITYGPTDRRFLVDVLHEFKLCFYLDRNTFILPDLLDTEEPTTSTQAVRESENAIQFVYQYEDLPKSIMPNFMVESQYLTTSRWRTGTILTKGKGQALISAYDHKLYVIVTGDYKDKRDFMATVRLMMDIINGTLVRKPDELIPLPGLKNEFADYNQLLAREKKGKPYYYFDEDLPTEKKFDISMLLDGIPRLDNNNTIDEILKNQAEFKETLGVISVGNKLILGETETISGNQEQTHAIQEEILQEIEKIDARLDDHYQYLIQLPELAKIKDELLAGVENLNHQQSVNLSQGIMEFLNQSFESNEEVMDAVLDEKLQILYNDLKKADDIKAKLKLSVPFINLIGIKLEAEVDLNKQWKKYRKWQTEMHEVIGSEGASLLMYR